MSHNNLNSTYFTKRNIALSVVSLGIGIGCYKLSSDSKPTSEKHTQPQQTHKVVESPKIQDSVVAANESVEAVSPKAIAHTHSPTCGCSSHTATQATSAKVTRPPSIAFTKEVRTKLLNHNEGQRIQFTLPGGGLASGVVDGTTDENGRRLSIQGTLSAPQTGRFLFTEQTLPGGAGDMFGAVYFDEGNIAYSVEPGPDGSPVLKEKHVDQVICKGYAIPEDIQQVDEVWEVEEIPADHPDITNIPAYQNGVIPLSSHPGSVAVVYLDFDGEEGPHTGWNNVDAAPFNLTNAQIKDLWARTAEEFAPFNINVTTDLQVYLDAPQNSRQRCIITPTTGVYTGSAGGVAYLGGFNSSGDTPCWCFYDGNAGALVIAHEVGHTLGLSHDGEGSLGYYSGHNTTAGSWGPIMGAPYGSNITHWSKGEYANANQFQDDFTIMDQMNNVSLRTDDHGATLATASQLEVFADNSVANAGVIETDADFDAFKFTLTAPSSVSFTVNGATTGQNLDILAEIVDSTGAVVASDNPAASLNATVAASLSAGEYFLRITGEGFGVVQGAGYSSYGSLGFYQVTGTVPNSIQPDRFSIAENPVNTDPVGTVTPRNTHADPIVYSINSGNSSGAFAIDSTTGALTVADSAQFNYETLSTYYEDPATFELIVGISNATTPSLNETVRVVVTVTNVNEAPVMTSVDTTLSVFDRSVIGTYVWTAVATDTDNYDGVSYSISAGNSLGHFAIDANSGIVSVAATTDINTTNTYNLTITASDSGSPAITDSVNLTINLSPNSPPVANDASFVIAEDSSADIVLGSVTSTDPDAGDQPIFAITSGDPNGIFSIGTYNGAITLVGALDHESTPSYSLTVSVTDRAGITDIANVTINVTDVTETPLAQWMLDETTGSVAADSSGNNHNGTVNNGATWVAGTLNNALDFDGVDDSVSFGTGPSLSGKVPFTIFAWVKVPSGSNTQQMILSQRDGSAAGYNGEYLLRVNDNGTVGFLIYKDGYQFEFDTTDVINDGVWHHVAAVRAGNKGFIYIDGVEKASTTGPTRDLVSTIEVYAGVDGRDNKLYFNGSMDDLRIYPMALSASEIALTIGEAPVANDSTFSISENSNADALIGTVSASDVNATDTLTYTITAGDDDGIFAINANSGAISLLGALDYEGTPSHTLTVTVSDPLGLNDTATITINVIDVTEAALAHWKFDETSGNTAADSSGNAHNGTVNNGGSWVSGPLANALDLDGVNDHISFGTGPSLSGKVPFTVSAWVKVPAGNSTEQFIISQRDGSSLGYNGEYLVRVNADGTVGFLIYKDGYQFEFDTTEQINDGTWHHVAAVRAGNKGHIYIDGEVKATATGAARDLVSTLAVSAGYDDLDNNKFFSGAMDDLRIHTMALSSTEISKLINDSDSDDLNDNWEMTYYGSLSSVSATSDTDGDGYNTFKEMAFGMDPTSNSKLSDHITASTIDDGGTDKLELKFRRPINHAALGVLYQLKSSTNLSAWGDDTTPASAITPDADTVTEWISYRFDPSDAAEKFIQMEAAPAP